MKHVYLHIGLEKTGTTSLQVFLRANEVALRANGYSYLGDDTRPYSDTLGHFPIAASFFPECPDFVRPAKFRPAPDVLGELRKDVEQCPWNVILSCEHFSSRLKDTSALRLIRDALPNHNIKVVCYLRRQDDLALAAYSTAIKSGRRNPFDVRQVSANNWYYNFDRILSLWGEVFGSENIVVREYDRAQFAGGDVRRSFLDLLGIEHTDFRFLPDENISLDSLQVEVLRLVNSHLPNFDEDPDGHALALKIRSTIIQHLPKGPPLATMLSESERGAIMHSFSDSNARLAGKLTGCSFVGDWKSLLTGERSEPGQPTEVYLARTIATLGRRLFESAQETEMLRKELADTKAALALVQDRPDVEQAAPTWQSAGPIRTVAQVLQAVQQRLRRDDSEP